MSEIDPNNPSSGEISNADASNKNTTSSPVNIWIKVEKYDPEENKVPEIDIKTSSVYKSKVQLEKHTSAQDGSSPVQVKNEPESRDKDKGEIEVKFEVDDIPLLTPRGSDQGPNQRPVKREPLDDEEDETEGANVAERNVGSAKIPCGICGQFFRPGNGIALHMRSHDTEKLSRYECDSCHRSYPYKINLIRHIVAGCPLPKGISCSICFKKLKTKHTLRCHMVTHISERPYSCELCPKRFPHLRYLQSHMTSHETERRFRCDLCGRRFKHSSAAASHRRRHKDPPVKRFTCSVCDKAFVTIHALEAHMRVHTNERPFACAVCGRGFAHKINMMRHLRVHEKPVVQLKCEICQKEFPKESYLKYHMRIHFDNEKPHTCGECNKSYSYLTNIKRHYRRHHPHIKYKAPLTDAQFANKAWERRVAQGEITPVSALPSSIPALPSYIIPDDIEPSLEPSKARPSSS